MPFQNVFLPSQKTERPLSAVSPSVETMNCTGESPSQLLITCDVAGSSSVDAADESHTAEMQSNVEEKQGTKSAKNRFEEILQAPLRARSGCTRKRNKPPCHLLTSQQHADFLQEICDRKAKKEGKEQRTKKNLKTQAKKKGTAVKKSSAAEDDCVCGTCKQVFGWKQSR